MKEIPQIHSKTGISQDYINEYVPYIYMFNDNHMSEFFKMIKKTPIKTYEKRYPKDKYTHNYDDSLKIKIHALDEFAKIMNNGFNSEKNFDSKRFKEIVNEVSKIVYGDRTIYK